MTRLDPKEKKGVNEDDDEYDDERDDYDDLPTNPQETSVED